MAGLSGTSSVSSGKSGYGGNQPVANVVQQGGQTNAFNSFNLRAKALAVREGFDKGQSQQQGQNQLDPAILARIALEEELKKRGGGGGGFRSFNPMVWIPYSFKLLAQAMDKAYREFMRAMQMGLQQAPQNSFLRAVVETQQLIAKALNPVLAPIRNIFVPVFNQVGRFAQQLVRNPLNAFAKLLTDIGQMGMVVMSAIANGLKRIFYGKEEDRLDADEEIYQQEEGLFSRIMSMLGFRDNNAENNSNIKSHIDNMTEQQIR